MLITIFVNKGGVGKSTLSLLLAKEKGFLVMTNDDESSLEEILSDEQAAIIPSEGDFPFLTNENIVFDCVPILSPVINSALGGSDFVIVPTKYGVEEIKRTIRTLYTLDELGFPSEKILVVANALKYERGKNWKQQFNDIKEMIPSKIKILPLKHSAYIQDLFHDDRSLTDRSNSNGLLKFQMREILEQINTIFKFLNI